MCRYFFGPPDSSFLEVAERGRLFVVTCVIGLHQNEVVFKGRTISIDGAVHDVESFISCWFKRG